MKAKAAMIVAHTMHRQSNKTRKFADCLKEAWAIVKAGRVIPVIDAINPAGRRVKMFVESVAVMTDKTFKMFKDANPGKVFGYENMFRAGKSFRSENFCQICGSYCWGDCQA